MESMPDKIRCIGFSPHTWEWIGLPPSDSVQDRILATLSERGPMTVSELRRATGGSKVCSAIRCLEVSGAVARDGDRIIFMRWRR